MASANTARPPLPPSHVSVSGAMTTTTPEADGSTDTKPAADDMSRRLSRPSTSSQLGVPDLPPRPSSAPPGGHEKDLSLDGNDSDPASPLLQKPSIPMGNLSLQGVSTNAISIPHHGHDGADSAQPPHPHEEDEKTSGRASRFVGNMLISRIGRASWQSLESTARLPFYLSPWGDNHPFTLPNVRKRDLALAGVAHFGLDALGASAVTVVESAIEHAVSATVEQSADEGLNKAFGGKGPHVVERRVGMNSLTLRIKHKLIGEAAELIFQGVRDSDDRTACAKGWFCPYLYASGREPEIARARDFAMAQLRTPRLAADASIAPKLLESLAESSTPVLSLFGCPWEDSSFRPGVAFPRFRRMVILLTGISPYRWVTSQSAWSHSRIPNEARITFHVLTHIPAIVLPVRDESPVLAWSPWTVAQMLDGRKTRYDLNTHIKELLAFVETVIDEEVLMSQPENAQWGWRDVMEASLRCMLTTISDFPDAIRDTSKKCCELERMGIVAFRY